MKPIEATGVTRTFGTFTAVNNANITLHTGEVVGLLGANGAGKTTLIKMILGLLIPTAGHIRLFGRPQSRQQRHRIGYVPQNLGLYPDLTAKENLEFRTKIFGVTAQNTGITPFGNKLVGSIPLGLQRRAAFAAATQHQPELLILDEPTSGVSPLARSKLWDQIHARAENETAVLVSTHYMDEALQTDRLIVMAEGKILADGSANEIVAGRKTVEITTDRWADAFNLLDCDSPDSSTPRVSLAGRKVRVMSQSIDTIRDKLDKAGINADVKLVDATLDETIVKLAS